MISKVIVTLKMEAMHPIEIADEISSLIRKWSRTNEKGEPSSVIFKQTMEDECLTLANSIVDIIDDSYRRKYTELEQWEEQLEHREDALETKEDIVESMEEEARWEKIYQMERSLKRTEEELRIREEALRKKESKKK